MNYFAHLFAQWSALPFDPVDWEYVPFHVGQELACLAAVRGSEIHFAVAPPWRRRLITRARVHEFLGPLIGRRGYLTTTVMHADHSKRADFVERMGFEFSWDESDRRHYMMAELPFKRENRSCQWQSH